MAWRTYSFGARPAEGLYYSPGFQSARERFIGIARALDTTRPGPERSRLVEEMHKLER